MKKRRLGRSAIEVAPLMLGGNVFGWTADEQTSFKILDGFVAAGFNFIDTADIYSRFAGNQGGESETILGTWMKRRGNRHKIILATKVGKDMGIGNEGLSKGYLHSAVDASLRRLQTDYIDLYQSHQDDETTPLGETLETYAALVEQGKVRVIGASNFSAERLIQALQVSKQHGYPRYESLQPRYNLYDRAEYETKLEPVCRQHALGVIPYYSLGGGFLTGKYRSEADIGNSKRARTVRPYLNERGDRILKALDEVAQDNRTQPAAVALSWLITRPGITAPIASATSEKQLRVLVEASELRLDDDSLRKLDEASAWPNT